MKKSMVHIKKILTTAILVSVVGLCSVNIAEASSVIGHTLYTDIIATINGYSIESYNINGYTAVVAEDLRNYGFDVVWKQNERALYINRNDRDTVESTYIAPTVSKSLVGRKAHPVLSTDIKTYINNDLVTSYNIDGRTIIYFDDLAIFGESTYDDSLRLLSLDVLDGLQYKLGNPLDNNLYFTRNSVNGLCFYINAVNNTNKVIKYFHVNFVMLNSVFDPSYDIYGNDSYKMNIVGPIYPGNHIANAGPDYGVDTYNDNLCSYVYVPSVYIEYMDGTAETIYYSDIGTERSDNSGYDEYSGYNM